MGRVTARGIYDEKGQESQVIRSEISSCTVTGTVYGKNSAGMICGSVENSDLLRCTASGMVSGDSSLGGVIGDGCGISTMNQCSFSGRSRVGGLAGLYWWSYESDVSNPGEDAEHHPSGDGCLHDSTTIQTDSGHQITQGKSASREQMKTQSTYSGWDFSGIWKLEPS